VSALDVSIQAQILNLMRSLQERFGLTYVVISHDLSPLKYLSDRIGVMYLGKLVELGTSAEVYGAPATPTPPGSSNRSRCPTPAREQHKPATRLRGELPSAIDPPTGCRFRTRCPLATGLCATEEPALRESGGRHAVAWHYPLTEPAPAVPIPQGETA
jgi:peptide/nickel transport system ATP-binding protein